MQSWQYKFITIFHQVLPHVKYAIKKWSHRHYLHTMHHSLYILWPCILPRGPTISSSLSACTSDMVPIPPQHTTKGTMWSICARHWTHFFMRAAHPSHAHMCPQGLKSTEAFLSEHTTHSSIWKYSKNKNTSGILQCLNLYITVDINKERFTKHSLSHPINRHTNSQTLWEIITNYTTSNHWMTL